MQFVVYSHLGNVPRTILERYCTIALAEAGELVARYLDRDC